MRRDGSILHLGLLQVSQCFNAPPMGGSPEVQFRRARLRGIASTAASGAASAAAGGFSSCGMAARQ